MLSKQVGAEADRCDSSAIQTFNYVGALELTGGDYGLLVELVGIYKDEATQMLEQLRQAIVAKDSAGVKMIAHRLKGASANVGGDCLRSTAALLESMGTNQELSGAAPAYEQLEKQLKDFGESTKFLEEENR
jgi:two-component system, sensor histidine kinase and response regulator